MTIQQNVGDESRNQASTRKAKVLRVRVVDSRDGRPLSNVTIPIGMVKWGLKMASRFAPEMKDANLDWNTIADMVEAGGQGELVHVEDEKKHETVTVSVE